MKSSTALRRGRAAHRYDNQLQKPKVLVVSSFLRDGNIDPLTEISVIRLTHLGFDATAATPPEALRSYCNRNAADIVLLIHLEGAVEFATRIREQNPKQLIALETGASPEAVRSVLHHFSFVLHRNARRTLEDAVSGKRPRADDELRDLLCEALKRPN